jgi:thiol:disulfide interchange protein DsbG
MTRFTRALLLALPIALAACGQSKPEHSGPKTDAEITAEIPKFQQPNVAAVRQYAAGFDAGNVMSARQVFVFFDPQCPHCGMFWEELKKVSNEARVTWIPVAILNRKSLDQGAAIMSGQVPAETMDAHEKLLTAKQGGMTAPAADARFKAVIERNTRLLVSFGAAGVPFVMSVHAQTGQVIAVSHGMPATKLAQDLGWTPSAATK